jgi:hypothetical protein
MTALSASYEAQRREGELISYKVAASTTIYKGALVCLNTDGYAVPAADTQGLIFIGVAYEDGDNSAGTDGAIKGRVLKTGTYLIAKASAAQADLGTVMCIADDNTVAADTTNDIPAGVAVEAPDSAHLRIRIDNYTK